MEVFIETFLYNNPAFAHHDRKEDRIDHAGKQIREIIR